MARGALIVGVLASVGLLWGCGSGSDAETGFGSIVIEDDSGCLVPISDTRIKLGSSGLKCEEAVAIAVLLSSGFDGPQVIGTGQDAWTCRAYPDWDKSKEVRCSNGGREFRLERTG